MNEIMRDTLFLELERELNKYNKNLYIITADFGSPVLDIIKKKYPNRFYNVGIAEQNLINIATGLALEGNIVFAYAIAPFITMRCYEQIRVNLAMLSQLRKINVNLIGVGAGFSYVVSGPSHHCLEDLSIMRTLPNIEVYSPCDCVTLKSMIAHSLKCSGVRYFRLDAQKVKSIYEEFSEEQLIKGFSVLKEGKGVCLCSTGSMTHVALDVIQYFCDQGINLGLIDFFNLKEINTVEFTKHILGAYDTIITLEEGFKDKGGLDSFVMTTLKNNNLKFFNIGLKDRFSFAVGPRQYLYEQNQMDVKSIIELINTVSRGIKV